MVTGPFARTVERKPLCRLRGIGRVIDVRRQALSAGHDRQQFVQDHRGLLFKRMQPGQVLPFQKWAHRQIRDIGESRPPQRVPRLERPLADEDISALPDAGEGLRTKLLFHGGERGVDGRPQIPSYRQRCALQQLQQVRRYGVPRPGLGDAYALKEGRSRGCGVAHFLQGEPLVDQRRVEPRVDPHACLQGIDSLQQTACLQRGHRMVVPDLQAGGQGQRQAGMECFGGGEIVVLARVRGHEFERFGMSAVHAQDGRVVLSRLLAPAGLDGLGGSGFEKRQDFVGFHGR